jgi:hypothetical protein
MKLLEGFRSIVFYQFEEISEKTLNLDAKCEGTQISARVVEDTINGVYMKTDEDLRRYNSLSYSKEN